MVDLFLIMSNYKQDGFKSHEEPIDIRINMNEATPEEDIQAFSVGYILGNSRAIAAVAITEAALELNPEQLQEIKHVLASFRYVRVIFSAF